MKRRGKIIIIVGIISGLFLIVLLATIVATFSDPRMMPGVKVALIEINGVIYNSEDVVDQLQKYEDDDFVKAIVLRINSPGGIVAPVQEIHREVMKIKEKKKVVVSMGFTAASGGYYIASTADWIFANPGTVTGSIGVIMSFPKFEGLMKKLGVEQEVIKSGKYKDAGSMYRSFTPEERELLQETIDDVHNQFLEAVLEGRKHKELTIEQIQKIADGRLLSGRQALEKKLVDQLGGLSDAIEYAGKLVGIEGKPRVITAKPRRSLLERLTRSILGDSLDQVLPDQALLRYEVSL